MSPASWPGPTGLARVLSFNDVCACFGCAGSLLLRGLPLLVVSGGYSSPQCSASLGGGSSCCGSRALEQGLRGRGAWA